MSGTYVCEYCDRPVPDGVDTCPACGAPCPKRTAAAAPEPETDGKTENETEMTPVEWIDTYFQEGVAKLRKKTGIFNKTAAVYVATDIPFGNGLTPAVFKKKLSGLYFDPGAFDYDRCIMIFDNSGATWGANTYGGIITLDGIWWSFTKGLATTLVAGVKWGDVRTLVKKSSQWKGDYIEINGEYVIIKAMGDDVLGRSDFVKFLSAISGCKVAYL